MPQTRGFILHPINEPDNVLVRRSDPLAIEHWITLNPLPPGQYGVTRVIRNYFAPRPRQRQNRIAGWRNRRISVASARSSKPKTNKS